MTQPCSLNHNKMVVRNGDRGGIVRNALHPTFEKEVKLADDLLLNPQASFILIDYTCSLLTLHVKLLEHQSLGFSSSHLECSRSVNSFWNWATIICFWIPTAVVFMCDTWKNDYSYQEDGMMHKSHDIENGWAKMQLHGPPWEFVNYCNYFLGFLFSHITAEACKFQDVPK